MMPAATLRAKLRAACWILLLCAAPALARSVLPGAALTGAAFSYPVAPGDSQTSIGARFGMEPRLLARINRLAPTALLKIGQTLEVDNRHIAPAARDDGIVINLPQRMLFRFAGGELQAAYPVGLGRPDWRTPQGDFVVTRKEQDKTWFVPLSIQREMVREGKELRTEVPPGPDNPLGRHWLGLSLPGIGIHGTIAPQSIYHFQSHGCIRLHPDDAAELYGQVQKGDAGSIIYQPVLLFRAPDGKVYLEVHRDIYEQGVDMEALARELADAAGVFDEIDWEKAAAVIDARDGVASEVTLALDRETP